MNKSRTALGVFGAAFGISLLLSAQIQIPPYVGGPPVVVTPTGFINGAGTPNGPILAPVGTVSAPSYSFTGQTGSGMFFPGGGAGPILTGQGVPALYFTSGPSLDIRSDALIRWMSTTALPGTPDTVLSRGGANLVRMGNATQGIEFNVDSVTLGACGTGAITTGSRGAAGEVTATGATSCAVNFTTAWTNRPFCTMDDETVVGGRISAVSTTAITFAGLTAGDVVSWHCIGRY